MSKEYGVIIEPEAVAGIESAYEWIRDYSPDRASAWVNGLLDTIQSLNKMPTRCPLALDSRFQMNGTFFRL
jgi:plasmid stabilization system protein ParE